MPKSAMIRFKGRKISLIFFCVWYLDSPEVYSQYFSITELVTVPAGPFMMGSNEGSDDQKPAHRVDLGEFSIDRTPVTNFQFLRFLAAVGPRSSTGKKLYDVGDPDARIHLQGGEWRIDAGFENHPVVEVSWFGARAYCDWVGRRLPTEAEWEKSARGTDDRRYPWGNRIPERSLAQFAAGWNETAPVGSFPLGASPYGVLDLSGNVWEWVSSAYFPYPYDPRDGREEMDRPLVRGTRGGGHDSTPEDLMTTHRGRNLSRNFRSGHHNIGFRCVQRPTS